MKTEKIIALLTMVILIALSGCGTDTSQNDLPSSDPGAGSTQGQDKGQEEKKKDTQGSQTPDRAKQGKINVYVEGMVEARNATLVKSEQMKYSLYVLENFKFTAEEPGSDMIFSNYDPNFFVRIQQIAPDTDLKKLEASQTQVYASLGTVTKIDPKTLFMEEFRDAKLCLHVDILKQGSADVATSLTYLVKDIDGTLYSFFFHMPSAEAAEGITPSLWAMVATLKNE